MEGGEGMMEGAGGEVVGEEAAVRVDEAFLPDALLIKIDDDFFGGPGASGVTPPRGAVVEVQVGPSAWPVTSWRCRHSQHRFPAPFSNGRKEGCRKQVLGVWGLSSLLPLRVFLP